MSVFNAREQQGAVLMIALVMLTVLTLLALNSMRAVVLDTRITAAHIETSHLQHFAESALREGEFRLYGPLHLRDKLEADLARNCVKSNQLGASADNRPCLLTEMTAEQLQGFFSAPLRFFTASNSYTAQYAYTTGSATQTAGANAVLAWMPYRGLDPHTGHYFVAERGEHAYWNSYPIRASSAATQSLNPEYGAVLEGQGTFFYLVTGQAEDRVAVQSTVAVIQLGLNQKR
ncbi:MAG: pilus assembly protein PilX [Pseudomonas sp.]|jgi:type IV pilus assembly protein PilX|nr:pilus assembly protein PilX [Pseudomonas sp.]MDD2223709.1 pilus assembly protein PilX [Pseudomonas sp.]MDY0415353.1 pilus assembly protein PilX [Pseudomonas sp.]